MLKDNKLRTWLGIVIGFLFGLFVAWFFFYASLDDVWREPTSRELTLAMISIILILPIIPFFAILNLFFSVNDDWIIFVMILLFWTLSGAFIAYGIPKKYRDYLFGYLILLFMSSLVGYLIMGGGGV